VPVLLELNGEFDLSGFLDEMPGDLRVVALSGDLVALSEPTLAGDFDAEFFPHTVHVYSDLNGFGFKFKFPSLKLPSFKMGAGGFKLPFKASSIKIKAPKNLFKGVGKSVSTTIKGISKGVGDFAKGIGKDYQNIGKEIQKGVKNVGSEIGKGVQNIVREGENLIGTVADTVLGPGGSDLAPEDEPPPPDDELPPEEEPTDEILPEEDQMPQYNEVSDEVLEGLEDIFSAITGGPGGLANIGSMIGTAIGGPVGSTIGSAAGKLVGRAVNQTQARRTAAAAQRKTTQNLLASRLGIPTAPAPRPNQLQAQYNTRTGEVRLRADNEDSKTGLIIAGVVGAVVIGGVAYMASQKPHRRSA